MKRIIFQIGLIVLGLPLLAQSDRIDSLLLDVMGNDKSINHLFNQYSKQSFIYSGISMDNKTFYAGRELGDKMLSVNGNFYFFHAGGLYLGASGSWFSQTDPKYGSTSLTAGIRKPLNRKNTLSFRTSFSRFFFNMPDSVTYIPYKNSLGAGMVFNKNWIGASLSFNLLFGDESGMNLTPSVFSSINIARFGKTGKILLSPEISAFIGPETVNEAGTINDSLNSMYYYTSEKYGLLNIQMLLPVGIYFSGFGIEAGYSINMPRTRDSFIKYPVSSFASLTVSYLLQYNRN